MSGPAPSARREPFEGLTVLDQARTVAGPYCSAVLADLGLRVVAPVPIGVALRVTARRLSVVDRGRAGLFVSFQTTIEGPSGTVVAARVQTVVCRRDGGAGSAGAPPEPFEALSDREPDLVTEGEIPDNAALLYQLNGDTKPLHVDGTQGRLSATDPARTLYSWAGGTAADRSGKSLPARRAVQLRHLSGIGASGRRLGWPGRAAFSGLGEDASRPVIEEGEVEYE